MTCVLDPTLEGPQLIELEAVPPPEEPGNRPVAGLVFALELEPGLCAPEPGLVRLEGQQPAVVLRPSGRPPLAVVHPPL